VFQHLVGGPVQVGALAERLGSRRIEAARRLLLDVIAELGGEPALRSRRVRAPR
jgi:hypothetical protein